MGGVWRWDLELGIIVEEGYIYVYDFLGIGLPILSRGTEFRSWRREGRGIGIQRVDLGVNGE